MKALAAFVATLVIAVGAVAAPPGMISLIQLIATPEKFHGQTVQVTGFCNFEFEGNAIYLHTEDYSGRNTKNAIWVDLSKTAPEPSNGPCIVRGKFDATQHGHLGLFSGLIEASGVGAMPPRSK